MSTTNDQEQQATARATLARLLSDDRPPVRDVEVALADLGLTLSKVYGGRNLHFTPDTVAKRDTLCGGYPFWRSGREVNYKPETPYCRKCVRAALG